MKINVYLCIFHVHANSVVPLNVTNVDGVLEVAVLTLDLCNPCIQPYLLRNIFESCTSPVTIMICKHRSHLFFQPIQSN